MNNLEIQNLTKHFPHFSLQNLSMNVPVGSIVGFVGENGSGKTTTLKLILNLLHRDEGTITLFGQDNIACENEVKRRIGVVFDSLCITEQAKLKQVDAILKGIYPDWDSPYFFRLCEQFQLPDNLPAKKFSKGMKMKLSIATALAHHPQLLLLDEPTSGLDPVVRNEILDLFLDFIQQEDHSILFSSHITSDIEKVADYVVMLHDGQVVCQESKDTLLYEYGVLKCSSDQFYKVAEGDILCRRKTSHGYELLVRDKTAMAHKYPDMVMDNLTIEQLMLFYSNKETMA